MTDNEFVWEILKDGDWHSNAEILYSIEERGCGLTVHSRISDLRHNGLAVEYRRVPGERGRGHQYRLLGTVWEGQASSADPGSPGPSQVHSATWPVENAAAGLSPPLAPRQLTLEAA